MDIKSQFRLNELKRSSVDVNTETLQKVEEPEVKIVNESFTLEDAQAAVKAYCDSKIENKEQIGYTLSAKPISLTSDNNILFTFDSDVQERLFHPHKQECIDFLRAKLNNGSLDVVIEYIKAENQVLKAVTPLEKFEILKNKNPLLLDLKKRFDLELDY